MSTTSDKILKAACFLFNKYGVDAVSQRNIADHIAISPGNLTYHFKKRDDIIRGLYTIIASEMDEKLNQLDHAPVDFEQWKECIKGLNKVQFEYRFFMIDRLQILRTDRKIKKDYEQFANRREAVFRQLIEKLVKKGWMRSEAYPSEYDSLVNRLQLFSDFWVTKHESDAEVQLKHTRSEADAFLESFYPYLTSKGQKAFGIK